MIVVVHIHDLRGERAHVDGLRPEPEAARLGRQADQVVLDEPAVLGAGRTDVDRRAVPEHDVGLEVRGVRGAHGAIVARHPARPGGKRPPCGRPTDPPRRRP